MAQTHAPNRNETVSTHQQAQQQKQEQLEDLLTIREVAKKLRVDDTTVRRWAKSGALAVVTLPHRGNRMAYRVKKSVLDAILKGGTPPA